MRDFFLGATVHCHHKGGNSQQEMKSANALSQQQIQLMQQQFMQQQKQLNMVNPQMNAIIQNGGLLPQTEAAARSSAMAQTGQGETQAIGALNQALQARGLTGGQMAGGGGVASQYGALFQGLLGQQASSLQNIQLAKANNLNNVMGLALGEGQMFGQQATSLGSQGVNALGIGQQAANAADQAQTGFWGSLVGGLAGLGGAAIGKGGILAGCWVSAELYGGWSTPETRALRQWIFNTWWMYPFALFYAYFGECWADTIRTHRILRAATKKLFDVFLRLANAGR